MSTNEIPSYTIRCIRPQEIEETYRLIDKEGWNLKLDKFTMLCQSSPDAFYVAVTEEGEIAGTMSLYPTFDNEFVVGNIVVKETHRYRGLGRRLMRNILAQHPGTVISLTAVPGADQFYLNIGFQFTQPQQGHDIFHIQVNREKLEERIKALDTSDITVSPFETKSFDELVSYDHVARGYQCEKYIKMQTKCNEVFIARNRDGQFIGFGVAFIKREEIVLDGLCADSDAVALCLFRAILDRFPGRNEMKLQVPSSRLFLSELGTVRSSYKYNRYSLGCPTPSPLSKVYNVGDCDYTY